MTAKTGDTKPKPKSRRASGRPTLSDVADLAGVGSITVSRALREPSRVSPELRERIDAAVEKLGYVLNPNARALASVRSDVIGVLIPSMTNNVFADVVRIAAAWLITTSCSIPPGTQMPRFGGATHWPGRVSTVMTPEMQ